MSSIHESLLPIVNERRTRYANSVRLLFLSFATLVAFHFIIFDPYLEASSRLIETRSNEARFAALGKNMAKRKAAYAAMQPAIEGAMQENLSKMMDLLAQDLEELTLDMVQYLPDRLVPFAVVDPGRGGFKMQMQAPLDMLPEPESSLRVNLSEEMIVRLGEAGSWNEIRELAQPEIQSQLIDVRFSEYNEKVKAVIDAAVTEIEAADDWKPKDLETLPEELQALWKEVNEASASALERLKAIRFELPEDERWWWSRAGKDGIQRLELNRSASLLSEIQERIGYDAVLASLEAQLEVLEETTALVLERQKEIEADFESFQGTIAQLLGPLDWLPLNMDDFVFLMPLLVAASFGGGVAWIVLKRGAYVRILNTAMEKSEAVRELSFTLSLDTSVARMRSYVLLGAVVAAWWVVGANLRLMGFVEMQVGGELEGALKAVGYSELLNWAASAVLLLGGVVVSLSALKKEGREAA